MSVKSKDQFPDLSDKILSVAVVRLFFYENKAHRSPAGEILIFRPSDNAKRLNRSAARLAMPHLPEDFFVEGLRQLIELDQQWVPPSEWVHSMPEVNTVEGFKGAYLLRRDTKDETEFVVLTLFDSMKAVQGFAGEDYETAVVSSEAKTVLKNFDEGATHYEIVFRPQ